MYKLIVCIWKLKQKTLKFEQLRVVKYLPKAVSDHDQNRFESTSDAVETITSESGTSSKLWNWNFVKKPRPKPECSKPRLGRKNMLALPKCFLNFSKITCHQFRTLIISNFTRCYHLLWFSHTQDMTDSEQFELRKPSKPYRQTRHQLDTWGAEEFSERGQKFLNHVQ